MDDREFTDQPPAADERPAEPAMTDDVLPPADTDFREQLKPDLDLAAELLMPNPEALELRGQQLSIPPVRLPGPLEFFRTHPTLRLTLKMVEPAKGEIGAISYGVVLAMEPVLRRYRFEPSPVTLYPIVIASRPLTYKLVQVKLPQGRPWDNWNLSKKLGLEMAVGKWIALRSINGGYAACEPDPGAVFPEPVFPDWDANEWLQRSLVALDLIIRDETHHVFAAIRHL